MYVTPKTVSRRKQKTNTTPQLFCTLSSTCICKPKPFSRQNQKLTQHTYSTTGKKIPPAHAKQVYLEEPIRVASPIRINLEEPVRVASPTRINLEEPVRVACPTRINLEEPSGYPAQPGLIHFSVCLSVCL